MTDLDPMALDSLNELVNDATNIDQVNPIEPIEPIEPIDPIDPTSPENTISLGGGNCICSCDLTCTRA